MNKSYQIRSYKKGDEVGIVDLLKIIFDTWPHFDLDCMPIEHWKWKYLDNPRKDLIIPIAECNGLIVGINHSFPILGKIGGKILSCSQGTDLGVHPEFRRMGIYSKMSDYKTELYIKNKTNMTWAVTANPIVYKTNMEWGRSTFPYSILTFTRIRDIDLHFEMKNTQHKLLQKLGFHIIKILNSVLNPKRKNTIKNTPIKNRIRQINYFDNRINDFWNIVKDYYDFIVVRNQDYLNWRYMDPRGGKYIINVSEENKQVVGYIVLRINKHQPEYPEGYIVDMLTLPNRFDVVDALLKNAISFFDNQKINITYCLSVKTHPYESLLKQHGFINSRLKKYFIIQLLEIGDEWTEFTSAPSSRLHFQYGDIDTI